MSTRRRAREIVLQLLYEEDVNGTRLPEASRQFIRSRMQGRKALTDFACELLEGTIKHRSDIDRQLSGLSKHWTINRMPVVDRNILRLGAYEILFAETPATVAVNESVILAKRYGDKNSQRFVNGILDRMMKIEEDPNRSPDTNDLDTNDLNADDTAADSPEKTTEQPQTSVSVDPDDS